MVLLTILKNLFSENKGIKGMEKFKEDIVKAFPVLLFLAGLIGGAAISQFQINQHGTLIYDHENRMRVIEESKTETKILLIQIQNRLEEIKTEIKEQRRGI